MIDNTKFKLNGTLWIEMAEGPVIGPGRVELLERIGQCRSIRQAAIQMKMSYRQAWMLIDHMNTHLDSPVVISHRGGKGGGYAEVTEKGRKVIEQFHLFYERFQAFLVESSKGIYL